MSVIYLTLALILNRKVFTATVGVGASHLIWEIMDPPVESQLSSLRFTAYCGPR